MVTSKLLNASRSPATAEFLEPAPVTTPPAPRLLSLDAFRGITIAGMLLVNNAGDWGHVYWPLEHAEWNGWTPTDLIFPFFLFIAGVAMTFSLGTLRERGASRRQLIRKVSARAAIIFVLGLVLNGFPSYDLTHLRVLGVLQRIALSYLLAAGVVLASGLRGQLAALLGLLLGYWALMTLVPVPGVGAGVLEPGRNLSNWIDLRIIGENHTWRQTKTWDPEGILSTMGAIGTALCGVLAGHWIRSRRTALEKTVGLFLAGNLGLVLGVIWNAAFPINKSIWTSTYVVFTAGMACHGLAMTYWAVDLKGYRRWATPFLVFGTNSIAAYWLSSLVAIALTRIQVAGPAAGETWTLKTYLDKTLYESWLSPINASLAYAVTYLCVWLALMSVLYRKRIFIKV
jgi:predicted acyltransferase